MNKKLCPVDIRVRFAPSPTGWLHLGSARTALFNYLFAKKNRGKFILRIEDTDIERSKKKYEKDILESLSWLGLKWDEGPAPLFKKSEEIRNSKFEIRNYVGDYGPYRQSERKNIYKKYIQKLLDAGQAFWCSHTPEELKAEKEKQMENGEAPKHVCEYKTEIRSERRSSEAKLRDNAELRSATPEKNKGVILRFACPKKKVIFNDLIRGEIEFDTSLLGDFVIAKDAENPLYNLAAVIDDADMKISHIIRGEDHISNTPKQILLFQALGLKIPQYAHIPLTLGPDKTKLGKRHGAVAVSEYRKQGYLPQALTNFMAFLGWNPGDEREFFALKNLEKEFSLERVGESSAIFNLQRLDYLNGYYIRQMKTDELVELCVPYLEKAKMIEQIPSPKSQILNKFKIRNSKFKILDTEEIIDFSYLKKIIALEQERLKRLNEIGESTRFFFVDKLKYEKELLQWKDMTDKDIFSSLDKSEQILSSLKTSDWKKQKLEKLLLSEAEKFGDRGKLLWPLRVALTGQKASPPPFEIMEILGKEKTLERIREAKKKLIKVHIKLKFQSPNAKSMSND